MAWTTIPGLAGKVYLPDDSDHTLKKHPCKGCFSCQWCDENRCRVCRQEDIHISNTKSPGRTACCQRPDPKLG